MADKVFITCAVTGSSPMPNHPHFPFRNEHVAAEALAAAEAGASIIHIHVRNSETGVPSQELEDYRAVVGMIRQKNNEVILNVTTGPGCTWMQSEEDPALPGPGTLMFTAERRLEHILDLKPDMCTLDICTMNLWGGAAINLDPMITRMGHMIQDAGVLPEIECFEAGDFVFADDLMAKGALPKHAPYSFVLGTKYGLPATPEAMMYSKNQLPRGAKWTGFGVSRHSFPMAAQAVLLGGNVRVGFEDTIYLRRGRLANNNAELVNWGREIIEHLGADVASAGETREMLGLAH
ncbi:3-keto-5-aminohexanoate cleavage protein [Sphingomonas canadensis]|uniref:3-keto-5-aminohexanoate cleavage protein n=1 Tax=Sphingomonas canadensis TaxID=1219257 RepID=A0ABW3H996_9SPHN|nr:3-keto-5-aminohexanoate cleavage protein [Sphingomonas canadensis]MCW3835664.1 3-keto-5-aminohexanoate cleavage protein [Sphingomonas canadensis]